METKLAKFKLYYAILPFKRDYFVSRGNSYFYLIEIFLRVFTVFFISIRYSYSFIILIDKFLNKTLSECLFRSREDRII